MIISSSCCDLLEEMVILEILLIGNGFSLIEKKFISLLCLSLTLY